MPLISFLYALVMRDYMV